MAEASQPLTVAALERWVLFGTSWAVVEISDERAVLQLCACTGEPVERRETRDPTVIAHVREASLLGTDPGSPRV